MAVTTYLHAFTGRYAAGTSEAALVPSIFEGIASVRSLGMHPRTRFGIWDSGISLRSLPATKNLGSDMILFFTITRASSFPLSVGTEAITCSPSLRLRVSRSGTSSLKVLHWPAAYTAKAKAASAAGTRSILNDFRREVE